MNRLVQIVPWVKEDYISWIKPAQSSFSLDDSALACHSVGCSQTKSNCANRYSLPQLLLQPASRVLELVHELQRLIQEDMMARIRDSAGAHRSGD